MSCWSRWAFLVGSLAVSVWAGFAPPAGAAPQEAPLVWRVLLIVKAQGNVKQAGFPEVQYVLSPEDVAAVTKAFSEFTPEFVRELSRGRVVWQPEVVVSAQPLQTVARLGEETWVGPECVEGDIRQHVTAGKYDGVFVYWKDSDDNTQDNLRGGFGWTVGPTDAAEGCAYSCVNYVPAHRWTRDSEWTEVFLHEWLHQVEAFYGSRGVRLPRGGLHGNDNYGFTHRNGWKHWYVAFLNADLRETDGTRVGLGEPAWRLGTIRETAAFRASDYLTPQRRSGDLLVDGAFENVEANSWLPRSWRGNRDAAVRQLGESKSGAAAAVIRSMMPDDAGLYQAVSVKPKTQYLLAGWVKTFGVANGEDGGTTGACLAVWGGFEASRSLKGTHDWTYLTLIFHSGDRQQAEIGVRLGHHGSLASGTAWFDDLVLIELEERRTDTAGP